MTEQTPTSPNPTSPTQLRELFRRYGFRPRQALGQTFLVDGNIARKIVRAAQLTGAEPVLEIGPGAGAVTRLLAGAARRVVAVEIDPTLVAILGETVGPDIELITGDILKVDLGEVLSSEQAAGWRCVANLPYAITGPAIMLLLDKAVWFDRMVIMLQREVAERLLAPPGDRARGLLTVLTEVQCTVSSVASVSRNCFFPQPKVDSTILVFEVRRPPLVPPSIVPVFQRVVKAAFSTRRKTLANALSGPSGLELRKEDAEHLLSHSGIDPARRAESLSAAEFIAFTNRLVDLTEEAEETEQ